MTDEFLRTHPNSNAILSSSHMTPSTHRFLIPQDHNCDQYVTYASKKLEPLSFKETKQYAFLIPIQF